ncbi:RNA polymerase sigma-54 factor [uncultured Muribaculum sp.]|uniref:RNA polymerase factor sigma-54 n=1 Tax=uncultured Muribaculum sp. TaxID=1918613 RepID=UPI00267600AB|nr:RNA polymerase sigma-54 factor [uncultured Muribaculum sp.]
MEESLNLSQQLRLQQKLSPLQVRFGRMLEMTGPEFEDEVQRMLDDNPALASADTQLAADTFDAGQFDETAEQVQLADYANDDEVPPQFYGASGYQGTGAGFVEPMATDTSVTLLDTIEQQLAELRLSERELQIGRYVAGHRGGGKARQQGAWHYGAIIRTLDPPGVGAVDLRDCLILQLRRKPESRLQKLALEIVVHYFDLFSLKHYKKLVSALNVSETELKDALNMIRQLNPKPGSFLQSDANDEKTHHIIPDFSVEIDGDTVTVSLLNRVPELAVETSFTVEAEPKAAGRPQTQAVAFVRQKREEAMEFMRLLKMRQNTLLRVMEAIVKLQRDFFVDGACSDTSLIRPMILKDVSALTGYDLSVISRATAGKYVATPAGVYPIKLFFNERTNDTDDTSAHEIMSALRKIVEEEDKGHPLSDDSITALLQAKGYDIARRTVAKYRERMGIPVGRLRKEIL